MTGQEFANALKAAGYTQKAFAEVMKVHRTTVGRCCGADDEVEPLWVYALVGLVAAKAAGTVTALVDGVGDAKVAKDSA